MLTCSAVLLFVVQICVGQNMPELFERKGGLVPDKQTAIHIAEAILFPIYGEKNIRGQRPYQVKLHNGKWTVAGYVRPGFAGGGFHIVILQRDGRIIEIALEV